MTEIQNYQIHIPRGISPIPEPQEISAAYILMEYLKSDATFLRRNNLSTADLKISGISWELKSPIGNGKHTIQNNLREASRQSPNIVIDLRRCKLPSDRAISRIRYEVNVTKTIKKLLVITKDSKVIDIK